MLNPKDARRHGASCSVPSSAMACFCKRQSSAVLINLITNSLACLWALDLLQRVALRPRGSLWAPGLLQLVALRPRCSLFEPGGVQARLLACRQDEFRQLDRSSPTYSGVTWRSTALMLDLARMTWTSPRRKHPFCQCLIVDSVAATLLQQHLQQEQRLRKA